MKHKDIDFSNPKMQKLLRQFNAAANTVKITVGIGNNAAWMACLDAHDRIKQHPRYNRQITGGTTVGKQFRRCFSMLHQYERQLIYTNENRFFHVADMPETTRRLYGDITDREYYDFWAAFGMQAYQDNYTFYTSLVNKLRLAYIHHNVANAEIMAWAVGAQTALDIAVKIWEVTMKAARKGIDNFIHADTINRVFRDFNLRPIADCWANAVVDLDPTLTFELTGTEIKNITQGCTQLMDKWMNEDTLFGSRIRTAEDYAEIFRTNGTCKKVMREFAEMRDAMTADRKARQTAEPE